jgi:hypothetical protein
VHVDVEPRDIFTTLIPTQVLLQPGSTPGAVPDAAIDVAMAAPATARNATGRALEAADAEVIVGNCAEWTTKW